MNLENNKYLSENTEERSILSSFEIAGIKERKDSADQHRQQAKESILLKMRSEIERLNQNSKLHTKFTLQDIDEMLQIGSDVLENIIAQEDLSKLPTLTQLVESIQRRLIQNKFKQKSIADIISSQNNDDEKTVDFKANEAQKVIERRIIHNIQYGGQLSNDLSFKLNDSNCVIGDLEDIIQRYQKLLWSTEISNRIEGLRQILIQKRDLLVKNQPSNENHISGEQILDRNKKNILLATKELLNLILYKKTKSSPNYYPVDQKALTQLEREFGQMDVLEKISLYYENNNLDRELTTALITKINSAEARQSIKESKHRLELSRNVLFESLKKDSLALKQEIGDSENEESDKNKQELLAWIEDIQDENKRVLQEQIKMTLSSLQLVGGKEKPTSQMIKNIFDQIFSRIDSDDGFYIDYQISKLMHTGKKNPQQDSVFTNKLLKENLNFKNKINILSTPLEKRNILQDKIYEIGQNIIKKEKQIKIIKQLDINKLAKYKQQKIDLRDEAMEDVIKDTYQGEIDLIEKVQQGKENSILFDLQQELQDKQKKLEQMNNLNSNSNRINEYLLQIHLNECLISNADIANSVDRIIIKACENMSEKGLRLVKKVLGKEYGLQDAEYLSEKDIYDQQISLLNHQIEMLEKIKA